MDILKTDIVKNEIKLFFPFEWQLKIAQMINLNHHTEAVLYLAECLHKQAKESCSALTYFPSEFVNMAKVAVKMHQEIGYMDDVIKSKREFVWTQCMNFLYAWYKNHKDVTHLF
jgi:hypothetical protein